jgi:hypothetical protein
MDHPKGPIHYLRRRILPAIARLLTLAAALLTITWLVGHTLTDRSHFSPYLWWLPTFALLALAWPMVFLGWVLERLASRLAGFQLRPIISAILFIITIYAVFGFWHLHRYLIPAKESNLRIVYWNLAVDPNAATAPDAIINEKPDLAIIANPRWDRTRPPLLEALGSLDPNTESDPAETDPAATHLLFRAEIIIATRARITRYARVSFDMGTKEPEDRGVILYARIEGLTEAPLDLWVVDMPSNTLRWRGVAATKAREAIDQWTGPIFTLDDIGRWTPNQTDEPFPAPSIIVGDFNTPRGSHSLKTLTADLTESFAAAGKGLGNTWPRNKPLLGIDLLYTSLPIANHAIKNPGSGRHRMLVVDLKAP